MTEQKVAIVTAAGKGMGAAIATELAEVSLWLNAIYGETDGQGKPLPARVDIRGARRLALLVESADQGDVLDRANWLGARLVGGE